MPTTLGAIVARFDSAVTDSSASGGLWVDEVPQQKDLPFTVLVHEGDTTEYTTENDYTEECTFRFEVFAVGLATAEGIGTNIKTAFDLPGQAQARAAFTITGGSAFSCQRTNYRVSAAGELQETSQQVYQVTINYKLWVRKSL